MKILWLKTELLHPVDKGGRIRTYQMLKELRKEHHITYLTLDDGNAAPDAIEKAQEYAHEVLTIPHRTAPKFSGRFYAELAGNLFSEVPYFMAKYRSPEMEEILVREVNTGDIDIVVCDFLMPSINVPEKLNVPSVLFQHNVEAMIWQRHYEVSANPVKKTYLKAQWQRTLGYERTTCRRFDRVVSVSPEDTEFFEREYAVKTGDHVPTGVDTEYFLRNGTHEQKDANIVFTGSMDWLPNEDAIKWFIEDVFPIVRSEVPHASLTIVGRDPFPALIQLAEQDPQITVTGRVPDVRPFMEQAAVYAVPIRIGGGTRLKLYEAMAMGLPVVSTTVGAEGLPLTDSEDILFRDKAEDFAGAIIELINNKEMAAALGQRASERVRRDFGWQQVAHRFAELCQETIDMANNGSSV